VSVGSSTTQRRVTNMAAGTAATDAVNVGQLRSAQNDIAGSLGGGAGVDPDTGVWTDPTYQVQGGTQNDVGSALTALDDGLGNLDSFAVKYDASTGDPNVPDYSKITLGVGSVGTAPVLIDNVAAGAITNTSYQAVNGAQVHAISTR